MSKKNVESGFANPFAEYRIKPFWFWNGDMDCTQIEHQIKEMADKGLGGAFICARQGLRIPYLSKDWFERVKFACDTAKKYNLETWLYDEYPYPSGMSGGEVMLRHPEAEHTVLNSIVKDVDGETDIAIEVCWAKVLYAKAVFQNPDGTLDRSREIDLQDSIGNYQHMELYQQTGLTSYNNKRYFTYGPKKRLQCRLPAGKWRIEIYVQRALGDFKYYGSFFDPCNAPAVRSFLDTTHEQYKKYLGNDFGANIKGMFSDEVGLLSPIPWSDLLPQKFMDKNGYSLTENLCALDDRKLPNVWKFRYDLYQTAHELLRESYHKQVSSWCESNGLMMATEVPSMRMSTQLYSHVVGGDTAHEKLGKPLEWIYDKYLHNYRSNAKSVSSLARQLGRKYGMIESFHSVGWSMTMQDAKWMIDRLGASGINFFNFHAYYYTIDSITKHDAPPSQFIQNPYWEHYKLLGDYVGRMSEVVSNTCSACSVAVLDPVVSFWTHLANPFHGFQYSGNNPNEKEGLRQLVNDWVYLCKTLLFNQKDYDHLDAEILNMATIENGKITVGNAVYDTLLLPPATSMELCATQNIQKFLQCGGNVIAVGLLPYQVIDSDRNVAQEYRAMFGLDFDPASLYWSKNSGDVKVFQNSNAWFIQTNGSLVQTNPEKELLDLYNRCNSQDVTFQIDDAHKRSFITSVRKDSEGASFVFVANQGVQSAKGTVVLKDAVCAAQRYDLENGNITPIAVENHCIPLDFCSYQSYLIKVIPGATQSSEEFQPRESTPIVIDTDKPMRVKIAGQNILRFDSFLLSADQQNWRKTEVKTFIEQFAQSAQQNTAGNIKLKFEGTFGTPKRIHPDYPFTCFYKTYFYADTIPENLSVLMDRGTVLQDYILYVNSHKITAADFHSIFVNDQNNIACNISPYTVHGKNDLIFEVNITKDWDGVRDNVYLYGDFSLKKNTENQFVLVEKQDKALLRNTYIEGFPFYSGTFIFQDTFIACPRNMAEHFTLTFDFGNTLYDCIEVLVNDHSIGTRAFTPYEWTGETGLLFDGENQLEIRLTNTLANMLDGRYFDYTNHNLVNIE